MEAFWAIINIADKRAMKKLCNDSLIKKYVASLFNLHNTKRFYQMKECLNFIYKNYYKFRKFIDKGDDIDENIFSPWAQIDHGWDPTDNYSLSWFTK